MSGLTELGDALHEEHFRIIVWISDLQNRVTGTAGEQSIDPVDDEERQMLHNLIESLDQVFHHHAFEEEVLFPLIRDCDDGEVTRYLAEDHSALEPMILELRNLATQILHRGCDSESWYSFCRVARRLFLEMMSHLAIEEISIIQRLDALLDAETDSDLARRHNTAGWMARSLQMGSCYVH